MRSPTAITVATILLAGIAFGAPNADLEPARLLARQGQTDEALTAAKAAATSAPDDAAPGRLIQDILREERRFGDLATSVPEGVSPLVASLLKARLLPVEKAEPALKALAAKDGAPPQAHVDLAATYLALDKIRSAETEAKAYIALRPDDPEGHYVLAKTRLTSGKALAAQDPAEQAMTLAPGWGPAVVLFADVVTELGRQPEARMAFTDALKQYPKSPALVRGLAMDQLRNDELAEAEATLGTLIGLRGTDASARVLLADVQSRLGKAEQAEESTRTAIELDPKNADAHRMLGLLLEKKDDFEGALSAYYEASAIRPDWVQVYIDQGVVLTMLREYAPAKEALEYAIKLDKTSMEAHFRLSRVQYFEDDMKGAKKSLGVVLKGDSDDVAANRLMGRVLLAEGKAKAAMKHFQKAADTDVADSDSMRMIGKCWLALGKPEEALKALSRAIDRDATDAWAQFEFGKALEQTEEFDDAADYYRKAIELDPKTHHFRLYLAELLDEILDDPPGAVEQYKAYLDLGGDDTDGEITKRIEQLGP